MYAPALADKFTPETIDNACRFIAGLDNAFERRSYFLEFSRRGGRLTDTERAIFAILSRHKSLLHGKIVGDHAQFRGACRERLRAKDYKGFLLLFQPNKRLSAFLKIEHQLPDKDYWKCLNFLWDNGGSEQDQREWLRLLTSVRPHRELLMNATERRALAAMPETLSVYRGYAKGESRSHLSWKLSENGARRDAYYAIGCGHRPGSVAMIASGMRGRAGLAEMGSNVGSDVLGGRGLLASAAERMNLGSVDVGAWGTTILR